MKTEWKVFYKPNAEYQGDHQPCDHQGLHGTFVLKDKAEQAVKDCEKYFNEHFEILHKPQRDGSVIEEVLVTVHDNVDVWIEKWVDGFPVKEQEQCEPKKKKRELATA